MKNTFYVIPKNWFERSTTKTNL